MKNNKHGLALDIDETLADTATYWIENLIKLFGIERNLTVLEIREQYHLADKVPEWQTDEALAWMEKARNSNAIQEELPLLRNADTIVNKIHEAIPIQAYITIRPRKVLQGTKKWLQKHGFPSAQIIARPEYIDHKDGNKWKAEVLEHLYPEVLGIVDDSLRLIDHLSETYQGTVYLYNRKNHQKNGITVKHCPSLQKVLSELQFVQ
ncbi:hypothetical protein ACFL1P_00645 [Patescibacteria group bacterium]